MADCPQCGKPAEARFAPFCSRRCQQLDLGRWLKGDFVIPASPTDPAVSSPGPDPEKDEE